MHFGREKLVKILPKRGSADERPTARTIGVPIRFSCPPMCSERELLEMRHFYLMEHLTVQTADLLALLVREFPTQSVYDVNGGLDKDGKLISTSPAWYITSVHQHRLLAIVARANSVDPKFPNGQPLATYKSVFAIEQSMRVKRARGNTVVKGRCLVYYQCTSQSSIAQGYGSEIGQWFDVTQNTISHPTAMSSMWQSPVTQKQRVKNNQTIIDQMDTTGRLPRHCDWCQKPDRFDKRHPLCEHCKLVSYCNRACQKAHWGKVHKAKCSRAKY
jgi:hypothetical protein